MLIKRVELENFRNHKNRRFEFSPGINLLLGKNGSGKSSIFEAIGLALFDIPTRESKINKENIITKNSEQKHALIRVEFVGNDGRTYTVERKIASKPHHILYDSAGVPIKTTEVDKEIAKICDIRAQNYKEVVKNVIFGYQNKLTEIFDEEPRKRSQLFNEIFNTQVYEEIWSNMKEVESTYKSILETIGGKLEFLENSLSEYSDIDERISEVEAQIKVLESEFDSKNSEYKELSKSIEQLEEKLKDLQIKKNFRDTLLKDIQNLKDSVSKIETRIQESLKAREVVGKNEKAYNEYNSLSEEIKVFEKKLKEVETNLEDLRNAEKEKSNLEKFKDTTVERINNLKKENERLSAEAKECEDDVSQIKKALDEIENNEKLKKDELEEVERKLEKAQSEEEDFRNLRAQLENLKKQQKDLSELSDKIKSQKQVIESLEKERDIIEEKLSKRSEYLLSEAKIQLLEELKEKSFCPLIRELCLNVSQNGVNFQKLRDEFESQKEIDIEHLEKQKKDIEERLKEEEISLAKLQEQLKTAVDNQNQIAELEKILNSVLKSGDPVAKVNELRREKEKILGDIKVLGVQLENENQRLKEQQEKIKKNTEQINENLNTISQHEAYLKDTEEKLKWLNKKLEDLAQFESKKEELKAEISKRKDRIEQLKEPYQQYILNISKSKELDGYLEEKANLFNELSEKENAFQIFASTNIDEEIDSVESQKKELNEKKEELNRTLQKLNQDLGVLQSKLEELKNKAKKKKEIESQIKDLEKEKSKVQRKLELVKIFREGMKTMGSRITKIMCQQISQIATHNYQKISGKEEKIIFDSENSYAVFLESEENGTRTFESLSGGEKISVAIALRTAFAKLLANTKMYILDEPTVNLDFERRTQLSESLEDFFTDAQQVFIVTHDETFLTSAEKIIML